MEAPVLDPRLERGLALAKTKGGAIKSIVGAKYLVPSASHSGGYIVDTVEGSCTCPDWAECGGHGRQHRCKHMWAVLSMRREIELSNGSTLVTQAKTNVIYPRDWRASNQALVDIRRLGPRLIADLVSVVEIPPHVGRGQPRVPARYIVQGALLKTLDTCSARAATDALERSQALGFCPRVPHYNTLLREIAKPEMTAVLQTLVAASVVPLIPLARAFAVDSTGFSTNCYASWNEHKHGAKVPGRTYKQQYIKAHACVETLTHAVTAVVMTKPHVGDAPLLPELVTRTANGGFVINKVTGDAAYLSRNNIVVVEDLGGNPYYCFKSNSKGTSSPEMGRLYHAFMSDRETYEREYHDRSNSESAFNMVKARFGGFVRSRKPDAQYNEVLCKIVCHNIACIVHAIHEFGIAAKFEPRIRVAP